jgi:hypothetical protein
MGGIRKYICVIVFIFINNIFSFKFNLTKVTSFAINYPGFTALYEVLDSNSPDVKYDLLISTFDPIPFSKDSVQVVHGIEQHLLTNSTNITPKIITTKVTWPNEISGVPSKCVNLIETLLSRENEQNIYIQ